MRTSVWILFFVCVSFSTEALAANEALCATLGVNCICSEPLNTNSWVDRNGQSFYDPSDTTVSDKQCSSSGVAVGAAYEQSPGAIRLFGAARGSGDPMFSALPNLSPSVQYLTRTQQNDGGGFLGSKLNYAVNPSARVGIRIYKYYSNDYVFTGSYPPDLPLCNSAKVMQVGYNGAATSGPMIADHDDNTAFYDIEQSLQWSINSNGCCTGPGPGNNRQPLTEAQRRGKWVKWELYMNNTRTTGVATTFEVWETLIDPVNAANNIEVKYVDTSVPKDFPNGANWTTALATTLHPLADMTDFSVNMFRSNNGNVCTGYAGYTHFLMAAWNTNAGQRIGAAVEIEGGGAGSDTTPPSPPANLRITMLP